MGDKRWNSLVYSTFCPPHKRSMDKPCLLTFCVGDKRSIDKPCLLTFCPPHKRSIDKPCLLTFCVGDRAKALSIDKAFHPCPPQGRKALSIDLLWGGQKVNSLVYSTFCVGDKRSIDKPCLLTFCGGDKRSIDKPCLLTFCVGDKRSIALSIDLLCGGQGGIDKACLLTCPPTGQ